MAYNRYRDTNGVMWTVVDSNNGYTLLGTVLDDADPSYDPAPEVQRATMQQGGVQVLGIDVVKTDPPTEQQTENLFVELRGNIEAWAKAHRGSVLLRVTPERAGVPWWVWVGAGLLLLKKR